MTHGTVGELIGGNVTKAALFAVAATSIVQTLVTGEAGVGVEGITQSLVQIGGPTAIGALVANTVISVTSTIDIKAEKLAMRGAIAGGVAVGVLILAGAMPAEVDASLISLAALVGAGTALGDVLAHDWSAITGQ